MANRYNILDDETIKRNRNLLAKDNETQIDVTNKSFQRETNRTEIIRPIESDEISYVKKYESESPKAIANPRENDDFRVDKTIEDLTTNPDKTKLNSPVIDASNINRTSDENEVVKTNENFELDLTEKYERNLVIFGKGISYTSSPDIDTIDNIRELENRVSERSDELGIFLFNLLPTIGGSVFSSALEAAETLSNGGAFNITAAGFSAGVNAYYTAFNLKYFRPLELVYYYAANFYSLIFFRGITVKYGSPGFQMNPLAVREWDGQLTVPVFFPRYFTATGTWLKASFMKEVEERKENLEFRKGSTDLEERYLSLENKRNVTPQNAERRKHDTDESNYIVDDNVLNVSFTRIGGNPNSSADKENETTMDIVKEKTNRDKNTLGYIYVIPVVADEFEEELPRFKIPFEFNPDISEGELSAEYESRSVLSRIGELQSFNNVGSLTVTLNTKYMALTAAEGDVRADGQSWMGDFTMRRVQGIEMAYRSLVMPHYPDSSDENQGYKYMKPPLIKVVVGDTESDTAPYAALLSYFTNSAVEDRINSNLPKRKLRTFIATGVQIEKNLEETPLYLNEEGKLMDTFGFDVSLNLTEVTPSYMDSLPDYKRYFNKFKSAGFSSHIVGS